VVVARARPSRDGHEQQPDEFEPVFSSPIGGARGFATLQQQVRSGAVGIDEGAEAVEDAR
jgi:hypothetical protein